MFEAKLSETGALLAVDLAEAGQDGLRAVNWSDLVA
jgi:hypothetical protein